LDRVFGCTSWNSVILFFCAPEMSKPNIIENYFFNPECARIALLGRSNSKKTRLAHELLENYSSLFGGQKLSKVWIVYSVWQKIYESIAALATESVMHEGMPENLELSEPAQEQDEQQGRMLILDDVASYCKSAQAEQQLNKLFSVRLHHERVSCILILQSYPSGIKCLVDALAQCDYFILTTGMINYLNLQKTILSGYPGILNQVAYLAFVVHKLKYFLIDLSIGNNIRYAFKARLMPSEGSPPLLFLLQ
jgi:hypothetical protein